MDLSAVQPWAPRRESDAVDDVGDAKISEEEKTVRRADRQEERQKNLTSDIVMVYYRRRDR